MPDPRLYGKCAFTGNLRAGMPRPYRVVIHVPRNAINAPREA